MTPKNSLEISTPLKIAVGTHFYMWHGINNGRNNFFLIDWLFKWTLRRVCCTPIYSWASGRHCKPTSGSRAKPWWGLGAVPPENVFCLYLQHRRKLAHRKNEILVLFCTASATDMFTINQIENSSFVYVKHVFLDISLFKKCFLLHFYKKRISKKIFSKSVTTTVYKDNLKPLSLLDVIF